MSKLKTEETKRITVAMPLKLYVEFQQFAFYRVWSDSKAGLFFIEQGLRAEGIRKTGKRGIGLSSKDFPPRKVY